MDETNYDWRIFDKFGLETKSKIIKLKFDVGNEVLEKPDPDVVSSGVIDYDEYMKKFG